MDTQNENELIESEPTASGQLRGADGASLAKDKDPAVSCEEDIENEGDLAKGGSYQNSDPRSDEMAGRFSHQNRDPMSSATVGRFSRQNSDPRSDEMAGCFSRQYSDSRSSATVGRFSHQNSYPGPGPVGGCFSQKIKLGASTTTNDVARLHQLYPGIDYEVMSVSGPVYHFVLRTTFNGQGQIFRGQGETKKLAKQDIARQILSCIPAQKKA